MTENERLVRHTRLQRYNEDKRFRDKGFSDKIRDFRWYAVVSLYTATHLIGAYFFEKETGGTAANLARFDNDMVENDKFLSKICSYFKTLRRYTYYNVSSSIHLDHDDDVQAIDQAFTTIEQHVTRLLAKT